MKGLEKRWRPFRKEEVFFCLIFLSNLFANLTQPEPPNDGLVKEIPLISGKSRLVKYYDLTRILVLFF